jgi:hypothetical protein
MSLIAFSIIIVDIFSPQNRIHLRKKAMKERTMVFVTINSIVTEYLGQSRIAAKRVEMMYKESKYYVTSFLA